jgi:hypothetical protein
MEQYKGYIISNLNPEGRTLIEALTIEARWVTIRLTNKSLSSPNP